jgi:hypothetical protein
MVLKEYHGKVFPNSRDSFRYLFEVNVLEFQISFKFSVNMFDTVK